VLRLWNVSTGGYGQVYYDFTPNTMNRARHLAGLWVHYGLPFYAGKRSIAGPDGEEGSVLAEIISIFILRSYLPTNRRVHLATTPRNIE
jgi:hypothetical protein